MKGLRVIFLSFLIFSFLTPQKSEALDSDDVTVIGANMLLQGFIGAIGFAIHGRPVLQGFARGMLGGTLIGTGKYLVGKDYRTGWPSKLLVNLGNSMVENTTRGKDLFDAFGFDIGPVYFNWEKKGSTYAFRPKWMLTPTIALFTYANEADYFDWKTSLETGNLIFVQKNMKFAGLTFSNVVKINKEYARDQEIVAHELIHTFQYGGYAPVGALLLDISGWQKYFDMVAWRAEPDFGSSLIAYPQQTLLKYHLRPLENEAYALSDRYPPGDWKFNHPE